jgi:hypothetical protein
MSYTGSRFQTPLYAGDGTGEVEKDAVKVCHLVELHLKDSTQTALDENLYITDNFHDIAYTSATHLESSAPTYIALGGLLGFGNASETTQIKINTISLTISGVDVEDISDVVHSNIINKRVVIYRSFGLATDSTTNFANKTYQFFDGNIKNFSVKENASESSITFNVASHWANFEATNGRKTNKSSQSLTKKYNSSDTFFFDIGFDFSSTQTADVRWGPQ